MSETCTHKPISLAYLGSSNRAHTVVLRGSSRARCERGLGWGVYRGSWAEPAWFSTACDPNRCMLKPTASLCAVHQNGILLASRLALRRADGAKLLGDSVDFGLRRRRGMHGGLTRHSRGEKIAQCRPPWVAAARSFRPSQGRALDLLRPPRSSDNKWVCPPPPPLIINHLRIRHSRGLNTACEVCKEYKTTLD